MSTTYFYLQGNLLGFKTDDSTDVTPSGTLNLHGRFREQDLSDDGDELALLPSQYHIAIAYKVLALISGNPAYFESMYQKQLVNIRRNNNRLNKKRRIRQYEY